MLVLVLHETGVVAVGEGLAVAWQRSTDIIKGWDAHGGWLDLLLWDDQRLRLNVATGAYAAQRPPDPGRADGP